MQFSNISISDVNVQGGQYALDIANENVVGTVTLQNIVISDFLFGVRMLMEVNGSSLSISNLSYDGANVYGATAVQVVALNGDNTTQCSTNMQQLSISNCTNGLQLSICNHVIIDSTFNQLNGYGILLEQGQQIDVQQMEVQELAYINERKLASSFSSLPRSSLLHRHAMHRSHPRLLRHHGRSIASKDILPAVDNAWDNMYPLNATVIYQCTFDDVEQPFWSSQWPYPCTLLNDACTGCGESQLSTCTIQSSQSCKTG